MSRSERRPLLRTNCIGRPWAILIALSVAFATASPAMGDLVVIGDFEGPGVPGGWGDWAAIEVTPGNTVFFDPFTALPHTGLDTISTYAFSSSHATSGTQSLRLDSQGGFDNSLAYNAGAAGTISDFLENDTLTFAVTFAGGVSGGYNQVFGIAINTNAGYQELSPNQGLSSFSSPDTTTDQTVQVSYDLSGIAYTANPTYLQLIIATNNDGDASHTTYYFDNFQLSTTAVPEPGAFVLLSLVSVGLLLGGVSKAVRKAFPKKIISEG